MPNHRPALAWPMHRDALVSGPVHARTAATVIAAGLTAGVAVVHGGTLLVVAMLVSLVALAAVLLRTEAVLVAWFAVILVDGRWLTYHKVAQLWVLDVASGSLRRLTSSRAAVGSSAGWVSLRMEGSLK